jgi:tripartite-type tricarboxylate transporter receptor subunit TctC
VLSLIVSSLVELIHRAFSMREAGLQYMLGQMFEQVLAKYVLPPIEAEIVQKLNAGMNAMMKDPVVTDRLDKLNISYRQNTPDEFRAFVASEMERWGRIVKEANIKLG